MKRIKSFEQYIKENYSDEEYFDEGPQPDDAEYHSAKENEFSDIMNDPDIKEFWNILMMDGIPDIKEYYPREICDDLIDNGYIEEDNKFDWRFTEEGKIKFPTYDKLISFINRTEDNGEHQSESPYMRGHETDGG